DQFLTTLSHELRSPLGAVLLWVQLLREKEPDQALLSSALEKIERSARQQSKLIDDLLDVSSIVTGKLRLNVGPVDLSRVVDAVMENVRPAAEAKGMALQSTVDPAVPLVSGDAERLQQILWNLVANAIKFTPDGGRIEVHVEHGDRYVHAHVTDSGAGIG